MKLTLWHNGLSTCSQKVRLALAESGCNWESCEVNLIAGEQKDPAYLAIHPRGLVPALAVDGGILIESSVINEFIADLAPELKLRPDGPLGQAHGRLWVRRIEETVHPAMGAITLATVFRTFMLQRPRDEVLAEIAQVTDGNERSARLEIFELGAEAPSFRGAVTRLVEFLDDLDRALATSPWICGERFSLVDCAAIPYVDRLNRLGLDVLWTGQRFHLARWLAAAKERRAYKVAIENWFPATTADMIRMIGEANRPAFLEAANGWSKPVPRVQA